MTHVNLKKLIKWMMKFWVLLSAKKNRVVNVLKKLIVSHSIFEETRSLKPVMTRPGIMYGLFKVHKNVCNCQPFRPIVSANNTPTYKLAKFLVPILKSLTSNEYTGLI